MSGQRFYWYVTYSHHSLDGFGDGALTMHTSESWFPIRTAGDWIKNEVKSKTVIIKAWRRISLKQREEFLADAERVEGSKE